MVQLVHLVSHLFNLVLPTGSPDSLGAPACSLGSLANSPFLPDSPACLLGLLGSPGLPAGSAGALG